MSPLQIVVDIIAGITIVFCIFKIINIAREKRYHRQLTEFALFCELVYFQMRIAVPEEYLKNRIFHINGELVLYNYLAFTPEFIKFFSSLGNTISEETKGDMLSMNLLDIDITGELEVSHKVRVYLKAPKDTNKSNYIEYQSDNNELKIVMDNEVLETDFGTKMRIINNFYKMLCVIFETPISRSTFDFNTFKTAHFKPGNFLNLVKMNGALLYKFLPVFTKEEIEALESLNKIQEDLKSKKNFDDIKEKG